MRKKSSTTKTLPVLVLPLIIIGFYEVVFMEGFFSVKVVQSIFFIIFITHVFVSAKTLQFVDGVDSFMQRSIDVLIWVLMVFVALGMNDPFRFVLSVLCLFSVAVFKHILLLRVSGSEHLDFIKNKLKVDIFAVIISVATLFGVIRGFAVPAVSFATLIFLGLSIYLIFVVRFYDIAKLKN